MTNDLPNNLVDLLDELERLFPNRLPRVTRDNPFNPDEVIRSIGSQDVISYIRRCVQGDK